MARKDGKDRGILEKPQGSGKWWVRLSVNGRERWHRADNKTQARALYGRLKAEIREQTYFPEKFKKSKEITLRMAITRHLAGSTNRSIVTEKTLGKFWIALWGNRLISEITAEDCRHAAPARRGELGLARMSVMAIAAPDKSELHPRIENISNKVAR